MNKGLVFKILFYYISVSFWIYKILRHIGADYIFKCEIEHPVDFDCLGTYVNSELLSLGIVILFLITDLILFKTYKFFIKID